MAVATERGTRRAISVIVSVLIGALLSTGHPAPAARPDSGAPPAVLAQRSARPAPDGSRILAVTQGPGRVLELSVHSAAMRRSISVQVVPAPDDSSPAPVLYLLNGVDGGTASEGWRAGKNWFTETDAIDFLADTQVTMVMPVGGAGSFYADWRADDPVLGRQRWTTFLTQELPPIIDSAFRGTGDNAAVGLSMSGAAVLRLATAAPDRYRGIASFSGCVRTDDAPGMALVQAIVAGHHGDPRNLWGPPDDPAWSANDPYLHADRLRGTTVYVATGTGRPGPYDTPDGPGARKDPFELADRLVVGGALETVTHLCTRQLRDRFAELGVPAVFDFRATGTHSWPYWQQDLHNAWPVLGRALGVG